MGHILNSRDDPVAWAKLMQEATDISESVGQELMVTIPESEYASLLRDRALAEKVRGMPPNSMLKHEYDGRWTIIADLGDDIMVLEDVATPEEALGIEEVE